MKVTSPSLRLACFAIAATVGLALSSSAQAQKVLVDLGQNSSFRGVTVPTPDANGNHWNSVTPGALVTGLVDTTGASTAFNLGWDTPVGTDSFNGASGGATTFPNPTPSEIATADSKLNKPALGDLGIAEAAIDYAASPGGANNNTLFDLENLDPTKTYTLKLFGSHVFSNDQQTTYTAGTGFDATLFTITGVEASASIDVDEIDTNDPSLPPNIPNGSQVATLSGLTPNSGGVLFVDFIGKTGNIGYLNSFELLVPEPTGLAMFALAGTFIARRRRH